MRRFEPFLPICITVLLSAVLFRIASAGDQGWNVTFFQGVAFIFLVVTIFRHLPFGKHAADMAQNCAETELRPPTGLLLALAAGVLAYSRTVRFFFICDDFEHLGLVRQSFMQSIWPQITKGQVDGTIPLFYRPLGFLSLFLEYRLFHDWAPGYHLISILWHLLCVAGVYFLCKQVGLTNRSCTAAAVVLAILPVNVQVVTWSACRFDQMATTSGVWSLVFAARYQKTGGLTNYWVAILFMVLALLSKESGYVIPVLLLALHLIPSSGSPSQRSFMQRFGPALGSWAVALVLLLHRSLTLGGLAGYRMQDGTLMAKAKPWEAVTGVFLRAPGEVFFGYNWMQPHDWILPLAAATTAAIFLTLCLLAKTNAFSSRVVWFCLIWLFVAAVPVHFNLWTPDPGLTYARGLYFSSVGASILVGLLFGETFRGRTLPLVWMLVLMVFLFVGVQHNLKSWQFVSGVTRDILAYLDRKVPNPPPNAVFYISGTQDAEYGVPFFHVGLENAVRFHYSWRSDIHVNPPASEVDRRAPVFVFFFN